MTTISENKLTGEFVSPNICQHLETAGLTNNVPYCWKLVHNEYVLWTLEFDVDGYYSQARGMLQLFNKIVPIPAYSIITLERCIPDHIIEKRNTTYTILVEQVYGIPSVSAERLPDAIAGVVLSMLKTKRYDPEYFNNKIICKP